MKRGSEARQSASPLQRRAWSSARGPPRRRSPGKRDGHAAFGLGFTLGAQHRRFVEVRGAENFPGVQHIAGVELTLQLGEKLDRLRPETAFERFAPGQADAVASGENAAVALQKGRQFSVRSRMRLRSCSWLRLRIGRTCRQPCPA